MTPRTKERLVLSATILTAGVLLAVGFSSMITPEMHRQLDPSQPIGYLFVPDDDQLEGTPHFLQGSFWTHSDATIAEVKVHYRRKGEENFASSTMQRVKEGRSFVDELPSLRKGERLFYYLEASDTDGNRVVIPPWAPSSPLFYVTFEGRPWKLGLIIHIVLVMGALLFLAHAFYYALELLVSANAPPLAHMRCRKNILWGWACFTMATLPLGFLIAYQTFGKGWGGWPVGDDITDNKSLITVLYWGVVLLASRRLGKGSGKRLGWMVMGGIVLTTVVYLIPHSFFFQ